MEKMVFTALTREELHALIIDSVNACLRHHTAQQPAQREDTPGPDGGAYINKRQAARLLNCSTSTLDNLRRAGQIKAFYVGKAVRFDRQEVLSLAKRHTSTKQRI